MRPAGIEQRDLVDGVFDDDAGGVQLRADVRLTFEYRNVSARAREFARASEPCEARADDRAIGVPPHLVLTC